MRGLCASPKLALCDIAGDALEKTAAEIVEKTGAEVKTYVGDISKRDAVYEMAERIQVRAEGNKWRLIPSRCL